MMSLERVSKGRIRGYVEEDLSLLLPHDFFSDPVSSALEMGAQVIKESRLRWAGIASLPKGRRIFLKRDRSHGRLKCLKYLFFPSRGRKEWLLACQLRKMSINIPKPLGWMEMREHGMIRESYYLSEAVGSGVSYVEDTGRMNQKGSQVKLAKAVKKIHRAGVFHKDFHGGNFLWDGESIFLTDLHGARVVRALSLSRRLWMISHLFHSLRSRWEDQDRRQFVDTYFEGESVADQEKDAFLRKIHLRMDRLQKRQWRSRTKRCLKESTEFTVEREPGVVYYRRRDVSAGQVKRAVEEHRRAAMEDGGGLVKISNAVVVSRVSDGINPICVKQFRYPSLWSRLKNYLRRPKGMKAWVGGNGLRARGVRAPEPLALVETRGWAGDGASLLMMEALKDGEELDRYLVRGFRDFRTKRRFIKAFARWLSGLHEGKVYHQDLKTCNIWVSEKKEDWVFLLLDLEDILLDKAIGEKRVFRSFLQLNGSIPGRITRTDRLRFLRDYLADRFLPLDREAWVRRIADETRRRGIVYVAPWGVVKEE